MPHLSISMCVLEGVVENRQRMKKRIGFLVAPKVMKREGELTGKRINRHRVIVDILFK